VLVSWNALMIDGMCHAGRVLGRADWLASARRALGFIRRSMWQEGRLLATSKDGRAHLNAYLDDYAFLLNALLELMQADFRAEDLAFAQALADVLLEQFEDRGKAAVGGFFFTSHDHEQLIHRTKSGHDQATPSGNGIAALALQRLGHVLGEARYLDAAERALRQFVPVAVANPAGLASLLAALEEHLFPPTLVILSGPAAEVADWQGGLARLYLPHVLVLGLSGNPPELPETLRKPVTGCVNAWVCSGVKCMEPIADFGQLERVCKSSKLL
jgi:uncharacterized protein YyaL (SSP411 family)